MTINEPLVSVLTPVYNMGDWLSECIESVLNQTHKHFEYIIVNNCSTDATLAIAQGYAKKDSRIRVHNNDRFVGVIENHNIAFGLMSRAAKYCKVVCADDFLFPDCIAKLVELAEANPSVGMVGSHSVAGKGVTCVGLDYDVKVVSGPDICRATLLGEFYVFGAPTSLIYRADLVRRSRAFYPNSSPHADTTACYELLAHSDFGFVHQILSYTRIHPDSQTSRSIKLGIINLSLMGDVARFGPKYLSRAELRERLAHLTDEYYHVLAANLFERFRDKEFWQHQKSELQEIGLQFSFVRLLMAACLKGLRLVLKPGAAVKKIAGRWKSSGRIEAQYYKG
jgi:glycosyltransferase involved in cell wall biosynthesis